MVPSASDPGSSLCPCTPPPPPLTARVILQEVHGPHLGEDVGHAALVAAMNLLPQSRGLAEERGPRLLGGGEGA